tara:strand:+ start:1083 stop:1421 length:339 start_codon:yes stop_codon:yes gene_type:complete
MKLTGKCKEEFEKWFTKDIEDFENYDQHLLNEFYKQIYSMQYGVLVDYFDSVKIHLEIQNRVVGWNNKDIEYRPCYTTQEGVDFGIHFKTRPEARTAATEKADELRNEVLNK